MLFGFRTENADAAAAALVVYAVYRSRNKRRGPSGVDMWGQIERFARASAKRNLSIGTFLELFKRKMACDTINPKWCESGIDTMIATSTGDGSFIIHGNPEDKREFLTEVMESGRDTEILGQIYRETARVILLVRERLEREKPIELKLEKIAEGDGTNETL